MLTFVPDFGTWLTTEKYYAFGYTNDWFYNAIIFPVCFMMIIVGTNVIGLCLTVPFKDKRNYFLRNLTGGLFYRFVEEYSLFFLIIAFYNCTHLNKTGAGYASFALSILFLALYLFTVTFLLIAFACWKAKNWPKSLCNASQEVEKSWVSMFIKIMLFYGKWLLFAFLISMDK